VRFAQVTAAKKGQEVTVDVYISVTASTRLIASAIPRASVLAAGSARRYLMPHHGVRDRGTNHFHRERLRKEPSDSRLMTDVWRNVFACGEDHCRGGKPIVDLLDEPIAVVPGHVPIDENCADASRLQYFNCGLGVCCLMDGVVLPSQHTYQHFAD
jgi:hypothetical protein